MNPATPPPARGSGWTSRYEKLRREVLTGDNRGSGLAVLLSRGMSAWLDLLGSPEPRPTPPPPPIAPDSGLAQTAPSPWCSQLTTVLAGIVWHGWQQRRHL